MTELHAIEIDAVTKETLKDGVVESLRSAILNRKLRPGQRIPESQMASKLGVSRAPVREALALLQHEGLVHRDQRGLAVAKLSRADVDEISSLRLTLETLAMREVIRSGTEADFELLEQNIQQTAETIEKGEGGQRDLEFHELMIRAARHRRLLGAWLSLRSQILLLLVQMDLDQAEFGKSAAKSHVELLSAMRDRDEERAVKLLHSQLENTHDIVTRYLAESN